MGIGHHMVREEANSAEINSIAHPKCGNQYLLSPLHNHLHLPKLHNRIILKHNTAIHMIIAGVALVAHLCANDFNNYVGWIVNWHCFCVLFLEIRWIGSQPRGTQGVLGIARKLAMRQELSGISPI